MKGQSYQIDNDGPRVGLTSLKASDGVSNFLHM